MAMVQSCRSFEVGNQHRAYILKARPPFDTPKLAPFKNGPFKLAIAAQAPVVPITFVHNWKLLPPWPTLAGPGGRPGFSFVKMHKPIPTDGMTEDDVADADRGTRK